ncbi:CoA transferase [Amycolatopsis jejuensis]|uniref:CoA transferase n=1 Tax=Amycolatopsis jejuensis TaxID=330084 RepID=UPI000524169F|nr:CoA transferase [Amycolatopsis jejuensis]
MTALLAGLRVVELSAYIATPLCGLTLAQLGADVIRVEPVGGAPDRTRWPLSDNGTSLYWSGLNKGKRAIEADLESGSDRHRIATLITDGAPCVVVTNTTRHPDLSYETLSAQRPDLIHVLLDGKADGSAAVDYTVQAGTGFPLLTGTGPDPVNHVLPAWDVCAGLYLAVGLLAAERHRQETGKGQSIRVALEDVALATAGNLGYLTEAQLTTHARTKSGNDIYGTYGHDFETADGERVMIVLLTERHWTKMLTATGLTGAFAALSKTLGISFTTESDRYRHRDLITPLLARWFEQTPYHEVAKTLTAHRILWDRYRSFTDLAHALPTHPLFEEIDQPGAGKHWAPKSPIHTNGTRLPPTPAPTIGEHTTELLPPPSP